MIVNSPTWTCFKRENTPTPYWAFLCYNGNRDDDGLECFYTCLRSRSVCVVWRLFELADFLGSINILGFHLLLVFSIYVIRSKLQENVKWHDLCYNCSYDELWMMEKKLWVHVKVTDNQLYDRLWMVKKKLWVHVKVIDSQSQFDT